MAGAYRFDPELVPVVAQLPQRDYGDLPATRAAVRATAAALPPVDTAGVMTTELGLPAGVRVRVYRPENPSPTPTGAILHAHGGGFVLGDLETSHARNVALVRALGVPLVSVDYRLAPEHRFPAALDDVHAAFTWLVAESAGLGVAPGRIVLHGSSAGSCLVAGVALLARDRGGPAPCFLYLGMPVLDDRLATPSIRRFTDTPMWDGHKARTSWEAYLGPGVPGTDAVSHYAAPARARDLTGLPPTYLSVMMFDPLRDEGLEFATALLAADVPVEVHLFPGTYHGSSLAAHTAIAQREAAEEVTVLRTALGGAR